MGGAPPLPQDFAPQGGKNRHFFRFFDPRGHPENKGQNGLRGALSGPPFWGSPDRRQCPYDLTRTAEGAIRKVGQGWPQIGLATLALRSRSRSVANPPCR